MQAFDLLDKEPLNGSLDLICAYIMHNKAAI